MTRLLKRNDFAVPVPTLRRVLFWALDVSLSNREPHTNQSARVVTCCVAASVFTLQQANENKLRNQILRRVDGVILRALL